MKKHLLIALITLTTVVACQKEKNPDNNPSNPGSSKVLKRIVETEGGVSTTRNVTYDANKRLTSIRTTDNAEVVSFTYDGNGNVTKIESKEDGERNVFEFTYNNNAPASGSFKSYEKDETQTEVITARYNLTYTVENTLVTKIKMLMPEDPTTEEDAYEVDYTLTYNNGNLTKIESGGIFSSVATFTYGNKKPIFPGLFKHVLDPGGFTVGFFAKNEVLSSSYDYPGTARDEVNTNVYTYDAQGYVLTINDGETLTRFEYE